MGVTEEERDKRGGGREREGKMDKVNRIIDDDMMKGMTTINAADVLDTWPR